MTWQQFFETFINMEPGIDQIALRLACAMVIGIVIGLEREFTHRPAGLRTHILVILGACVISVTGEILFHQYLKAGATPDPARLSAQVITGVGFLGAGTIMKEGVNVKGLTTAASVWAVACLGIACGFGYYFLALLGMVCIMITLTIIEKWQHRLIPDHNSDINYKLVTDDLSAALAFINENALTCSASVYDVGAVRNDDTYCITFRCHFAGRKCEENQRKFFEALASHPSTHHLCPITNQTGATV